MEYAMQKGIGLVGSCATMGPFYALFHDVQL